MRARWAVPIALVVALGCSAPALASSYSHGHGRGDSRGHDRGHHQRDHGHSHHNSWWDDDDNDDDDDHGDSDSSSDGSDIDVEGSVDIDTDIGDIDIGGTVATGNAQQITARLTGYSYQDNTPPGSAIISMPVLHKKAGGTGTFADPITTAVPGHAGSEETPKGTRIYVSKLRRYFIVEDSGASKTSQKHFDLWVDGQGFSKSASDKCMNSYTGSAPIILNPSAGLPVTAGPLTGPTGCRI